jgi:hypothetical protein
MPKKYSLEEIFEYHPDSIHLTGFPEDGILEDIGNRLRLEKLLKSHARLIKTYPYVLRTVDPSFNPKHIIQRQNFFRTLDAIKNKGIKKTFFDRGLPKTDDGKLDGSYASFFELCSRFYKILETAKTELKDFRDVPEAKRILSRIRNFDSGLSSTLEVLETIESAKTFAIDTAKGTIASIPKMPLENVVEFMDPPTEEKVEWGRNLLHPIRVKMKKQAVALRKEAGIEFRRKIIEYVKGEFKFRQGVENFRADFESLALPIRFHSYYNKLLSKGVGHSRGFSSGDFDVEEFGELEETGSSYETLTVPGPIYPKFGRHYCLEGLFPPKLLDGWCGEYFVPIDLTLEESERKVLIAGLHSGSKSFLLENLVILSILGQTGVSIPGKSIVLPKYDKMFYYRCVDNDQWSGKLETELKAIDYILRCAGAKDLVVIDEFLDATSAEISSALGPRILDKLLGLKSRVFVTSHRTTDYTSLANKGWTLMTPEYEIKKGKIHPTLRIKRGAPDEGINLRYVMESCEGKFRIN